MCAPNVTLFELEKTFVNSADHFRKTISKCDRIILFAYFGVEISDGT